MRKFIIERELPAIGSAERQALREAAQKSNATLKELGPDIQWVESYVANDKTFCVYLARDEAIIQEHARRSGFPANKVTEVRRMIDKLRQSTAADQIASGAAWIGSPDEVIAAVERSREEFGGFEHASLQVNFNMMPLAAAQASMRLFAERVMPRFTAGS